eukprot:jgi/Astpho2/1895/Aster-00415
MEQPGCFSGPRSGAVPNLFWRHVSHESLRKVPDYKPLPKVEQLPLDSPACYRQVRQDTVLWGQLHQGVLTTGQLNAALGFYEPEAAHVLGIPGNRVRHGALLAVYSNLQQPPYIPEPQVALGRPDPAPGGAAPASMPPGGAAHMLLPGAEAQLPKLMRPEGMRRTAWRNKLRRVRKQQGQPSPAVPQATAQLRQQQQAHKMELDRLRIVREAQQAKSRAAAAQGIGRVRTSWGSTQEAGALYGLMGHLPPSSQLEEIGLCYLDPDSPALAGMGFAAGTLPPLGASPDGFLRHESVPTFWTPQLQLEMLAAGVYSALVVSRSATQGLKLFRMLRDDSYLQAMLSIVSSFYTLHVLPAQPPPDNMFFQLQSYQAFLHSTMNVAASAVPVAYFDTQQLMTASDNQQLILE